LGIEANKTVLFVNPIGQSNRCALITSAHSPCWMETSEQREHEWARCPRNPEFAAAEVCNGDDFVDAHASAVRVLLASLRDLNRLTQIRKVAP
jgi:hypothetical protein